MGIIPTEDSGVGFCMDIQKVGLSLSVTNQFLNPGLKQKAFAGLYIVLPCVMWK